MLSSKAVIIGVDPGSIALPAIATAAGMIPERFAANQSARPTTWDEPPILNAMLDYHVGRRPPHSGLRLHPHSS